MMMALKKFDDAADADNKRNNDGNKRRQWGKRTLTVSYTVVYKRAYVLRAHYKIQYSVDVGENYKCVCEDVP